MFFSICNGEGRSEEKVTGSLVGTCLRNRMDDSHTMRLGMTSTVFDRRNVGYHRITGIGKDVAEVCGYNTAKPHPFLLLILLSLPNTIAATVQSVFIVVVFSTSLTI